MTLENVEPIRDKKTMDLSRPPIIVDGEEPVFLAWTAL